MSTEEERVALWLASRQAEANFKQALAKKMAGDPLAQAGLENDWASVIEYIEDRNSTESKDYSWPTIYPTT